MTVLVFVFSILTNQKRVLLCICPVVAWKDLFMDSDLKNGLNKFLLI